MSTDVVRLPYEDWEQALLLLNRSLPIEQRTELAARLIREANSGLISLEGLLGSRHAGRLVGVIWSQLQPGRTASIWPPQTSATTGDELIPKLLEAACAYACKSGARLAQALLETEGQAGAGHFARAGFEHIADLLYLVSTPDTFPGAEPGGELLFAGYEQSDESRLSELLLRTYQGTLDCPKLNGMRNSADVLTGYQAVSAGGSSRWLFLRRRDRDVGCLLLAEHPAVQNWEVVYVGIVPEERGRAWGLAAIRHAQWLAGKAKAARLVLAVDAANSAALRMYSQAGFEVWDRRTAMVKVFA